MGLRMKDVLTRGLSKNGHINAIACSTTNLVNEAQKLHDLWPVASAALGRTLTAGVMMASQLKDEKAKIEIQIDGDGPLGKIMVDAKNDGTVRGYVDNPHVNFELKDGGGLNVGIAVGKGTLRVIKNMGMKEPFIGTVDLQTGEIGDDLSYYYAVSEQIPSAVGLGVLVDPDEHIISSGGFLVQMMPEVTDEEIEELEKRMKEMKHISSYLQEGYSPIELIKILVPDYEELETMELGWKCNCSRERCETILRTLRFKDLKDILEEDKKCDMHCEFCSTTYHFDEEEIRQIYEERVNEIKDTMINHESNMED